MSFAAPMQLAWLALLVPLVGLYILRRKRERRAVSSTVLWEAALRDLRAESPFRRLVPHLSLLLQALVLVLGALALARPVGTAPVPRGAIVAVVVDTSLSMSTGGVGEPPSASPLAQARRYVATRASNLPPGGQLLVVAAGRSPELLAPLSSDRVVLARAAEALRVTCPKADLNAALHATLERLRDAPSGSEIVVLTDGAHDEPLNTRGVSLPVSVQLLARDADRPNTAILSADARTRHDAGSADRAEVFVRVAHFGPAPREVFVTVSALVAGEQASDETPILASERVLIAPGEPANLVLAAELPPDSSGRAPFVRVAVAGAEEGGGDALAADDVVVLPSPAARRLPVFMVGSVPESVQRVFRTDPELELFATTLERLAQRESGEPPLDGLMVFGGRVPDEVPPGGALVLSPEGEEVFGLPLGERVASTQVTRWDETDPLLRFVPLADVTLADVRTLPSSVRPLVHTQLGAVVGILPGAQGDVVFVAVDPDRGGWSRTPGFVIFFRNILERARERRAAGGVPAGEVGEALRVAAAQGERVRVEAPDGSVREVEGTAGVALVPVPPLAGAFQVAVGERRVVALRNVLQAAASDLRTRLVVTEQAAGEASPDAPLRAPGPVVEELALSRALWPLFALALLLVAALEVGWATRREAA